MKVSCSKAGIQVMQFWSAIGCGIVSIMLFWQIWWLCVIIWIISSFCAAFFIKLWAKNIHLTLTGIELQLETGGSFHTIRRQPIWNLTSVQILQTPLLRQTKSCFLLLYSTHSVWIIPAVDIECAEKLTLLPGNGGKYS